MSNRVHRETSAIVYKQIQEEGLLKKVQLTVYKTLYNDGPYTTCEIADRLKTHPNYISGRLSELRKRGVVRETKKRPCKITGRVVLEFDVTKNVPTPWKRTATKDDKIKALKEEIKFLKKEVKKYKKQMEFEF